MAMTLATSSAQARDLYVKAVDNLLGGGAHMSAAFDKVVEADPGFALAHSGLARARQIQGDVAGVREAMTTARSLTGGLSAKEQSHINALGLLIDGKGAEA